MAKKNNKQNQGKKTLPRKQRLRSAKSWLVKYEGIREDRKIVKGYRKKYGVDFLCAIKELEMLGVKLSDSYKEGILAHLEREKKNKEAKLEKQRQRINVINDYSNEDFAFIVGYTSGGAPYGLTRDQMDDIDDLDELEEL